MAGNPQWCLSLDEWRDRFFHWVHTPEPKALLNATIFFDLRSIYGAGELAQQMQSHLFKLTRGDAAFLRMLAQNSLAMEPPLGVFRGFVTEKDAQGKQFINLKKYGSRLFVDVARVFALAHGIEAASTAERLRRVVGLPSGMGDDVDAVLGAFNFIQRLRLSHQHAIANANTEGENDIYIARLNTLERKFLKEAFRQAQSLQQRLKLTYQL